MPITRDDLDAFHEFALARIQSGGSDLTWDELVELWRDGRPASDRRAAAVAAIRAAIDDMHVGDHGEPAGQAIEELRRELGLGRDG